MLKEKKREKKKRNKITLTYKTKKTKPNSPDDLGHMLFQGLWQFSNVESLKGSSKHGLSKGELCNSLSLPLTVCIVVNNIRKSVRHSW